MLRDLRSLNRQKYQRKLNKIVREFNQSIKDDWLWNGRFIMRQRCAWFKSFEDHSGAQFEAILELKDMKTGKIEARIFGNYDIEWHLYKWANECITNYWDVWKEEPDPNKQARLEGRVPN